MQKESYKLSDGDLFKYNDGILLNRSQYNDEFIDVKKNGDVFMGKWMSSLNRLSSNTVFDFMDNDKNGFVDKVECILFSKIRFDNIEVTELQNELLMTIKQK